MELLTNIFGSINGVVWGPLMLILLFGVGIYLQLGLKLLPIRKLGLGFSLLWQGAGVPTTTATMARSRRSTR